MKKILVLGANWGVVRYLIDYFNENGSENFEISVREDTILTLAVANRILHI